MNGLEIQVSGFNELKAKLDRMPQEIQREGQRLIFDGVQRMANVAKANVPVDVGFAKNLIYAEKVGNNGAALVSGADYSAYLEWGTGERVNIAINPAEREYEESFRRTKQVVGQFAQPFFFPAVYEVTPSIIKDVETMLQEVADK